MSDFFSCYLLWLLLGLLLGFLLFYLYDLLFRRNDDNNDHDNQYNTSHTQSETPSTPQFAAPASTAKITDHITMSADSTALSRELGLKPQKSNKDDLTVVEGIGPKISQLLIADGIETFRQLEKTEVSKIQTILDNAGPSFKLAKPESWPRQSALCVTQDWKELKEFQDRLFNGVEFDN